MWKFIGLGIVLCCVALGVALFHSRGVLSVEDRQRIEYDLVDSEGIRYRNVHRIVCRQLVDFEPNTGFCGELNSRNRLGGYSGFRRFVLFDPTVTVPSHSVWIEGETAAFPWVWEQCCK